MLKLPRELLVAERAVLLVDVYRDVSDHVLLQFWLVSELHRALLTLPILAFTIQIKLVRFIPI